MHSKNVGGRNICSKMDSIKIIDLIKQLIQKNFKIIGSNRWKIAWRTASKNDVSNVID